MTKNDGQQLAAVEDAAAIGADQASPPPPASVKRLAVSGSVWTVGGFGAGQVLRLGSNMVMARLLFPGAFGIMTIVNLVVTGLQQFSDFGIRGSIIYNKRGRDPVYINTAWTIQVVRGIALWIICCALAWPAAWFYSRSNSPHASDAWQLLWLLPVSGLNAVVTGFFSPARMIMFRDLDAKTLTFMELAQQIGSIIIMFIWAYYQRSVWSFVAGILAGNLIMLALTYIWASAASPPAKFMWDREARRDLFGYGQWVFISTLTMFVAGQFDKLFLGREESLATLGVYSFAGLLSLMPRQVSVTLTGWVLQPAIAKTYRKDPAKLQLKVNQARSVILPAGLVVSVAIALFSPAFFQTLYRKEYWDAGWQSQLLSVAFWFMILQASSDKTLLAIGDSKSVAISNVVNAVMTVVGCVLGYHFAKFLGVTPITGLIIGTGIGNLAGEVVIDWALLKYHVNIIRADILYTALFMGLVGVGVYASHVAVGHFHRYREALVSALVASVIVIPTMIWAARRVIREVL